MPPPSDPGGQTAKRSAQHEESLPAYLLDGPAALSNGPVRRGVLSAHPLPSGLGRTLTRMGRALDRDSDLDTDSTPDWGGGFSCGGGAGMGVVATEAPLMGV
ncbi:hypothetical protein [Streptomyces sp. NPDC057438]|uniref:hypothetical protein n=1 Tax=Streptomyces sp. NPDC057438 TaxID=3346133 RepID=UPI0036786387